MANFTNCYCHLLVTEKPEILLQMNYKNFTSGIYYQGIFFIVFDFVITILVGNTGKTYSHLM